MTIISFGYRYLRSAPIGADIVFDARCLKEDPAEHDKLHALSGLDADVQNYLASLEDVQKFLDVATAGAFAVSSDASTTIAIACHSGRHRSVYLVDQLGKLFPHATVSHLDIDRDHNEDHAPDFV